MHTSITSPNAPPSTPPAMMPVTTSLVLVVDDEKNTAFMLRHMFERESFRVIVVYDGLSALNLAATEQPDLILLDILMPGMNGFEVLRRLRENPETASIPTILMTANAREPSDVARGLNLGADDYIYKPFSPQELIARARSKIRAYHLEEALQRRSQELEALLHASERLNTHLAPREVAEVVLQLVDQLIPTDVIAIFEMDEDGFICDTRSLGAAPPNPDHVLERVEAGDPTFVWDNDPTIVAPYPAGIAMRLEQGKTVCGMLLVAGQAAYDDNHQRLFEGIARQAALALRNAQLYEVQANYAEHLEDMVAARTAELERTQKMLLRSEKLASIGHLAASIAHEINNPLMPIRNLLDDIVEDLDIAGVSYDQRSIELIRASLDRIRGIVSRLLEFSRDSHPEMSLIDVSGVLDGVISLNRKFFEHERVQVDADLPTLPPIYGSKDQLEQVFMNLALNAEAAMPDGGTLYVRACIVGENVVVQFEDTGMGIPPENLNRIFDPFFSTKPNGTGLGLFVSHGIIDGHHGEIEVASTLNQGTIFTVRLPTHKP